MKEANCLGKLSSKYLRGGLPVLHSFDILLIFHCLISANGSICHSGRRVHCPEGNRHDILTKVEQQP